MTSPDAHPAAPVGYRWVILAVFFLLTLAIAVQWLTFAPIQREARVAYDATAMQIDFLSIIFMAVFLFVCIPASYVIDEYGIRVGIGIGAALTGIFGIGKGIFAHSYAMMVVCQFGLGVAQPFILNAATAVAAKWFPTTERAGAVGVATLAQFIGFIIVNVATPHMVVASGGSYDLRPMLTAYGCFSVVIAAAFLMLMREAPPYPPSVSDDEVRLPSGKGFRHILRQRDMAVLTVLFFFGLGIFNAVTTCIDQICESKGLTSPQAGSIMGAMFIAGIVGALFVPAFSDKLRRRRPFMIAATTLIIPGMIGMTFASGYGMMCVSAALVGFFLLGVAGPIGFQYGAEVCLPAPEPLSQGIVLLAGQVSGVLFVIAMNAFGMKRSMLAFALLSALNVFLAMRLRPSPFEKSQEFAPPVGST